MKIGKKQEATRTSKEDQRKQRALSARTQRATKSIEKQGEPRPATEGENLQQKTCNTIREATISEEKQRKARNSNKEQGNARKNRETQ